MDIFSRIAAALALLASGATRTDPAVTEHLQAIDAHLEGTDAHEAADHDDESARLDAIEAGLGKIADAVAPEPAADPAPAEDETPTPAPAPAPVGEVASGVTTGFEAPTGDEPPLA